MKYTLDYAEYDFILTDYLRKFGSDPVRTALDLDPGSRTAIQRYIRRVGEIATSLAESYSDADSEGCRLEGGQVQIPRSFIDLWARYHGEIHLDARTFELGAGDVPRALRSPLRQIATEMLLGANPSFLAYGGFTHMAIPVLESFGTEAQKAIYLSQLRSGRWDACFCVTEEAAGSDLTQIQTEGAATDLPECFTITGRKAFITAGMHGLTENTLYLVLGRSSNSQGLTCFLVPRLWPEADGTLTDNFVRCFKVDEKMGLRACANTHLAFGEAGRTMGGALGGRVGIGFAQVAPLMARARLMTAQFGLAIASRAYRTAVTFACTRKQGRRLTERDGGAPQVAIIHHSDVQRMLLEMKARVEAFRGMITMVNVHLALLEQKSDSIPAETAFRARNLSRFYVPILKAYVSDQAWRVCELAIQVHGGRGFLREYGVEQCARDVKVLSLWEGTNYIQALDLLGDKLRFGLDAQVWRTFKDDFGSFLALASAYPELATEFGVLARVSAAVMTVIDNLQDVVTRYGYDAIAQFATRYLACLGDICAGRALLEAACIACDQVKDLERVGSGKNGDRRPYLVGKMKSCRFFLFNILPHTETTSRIISDMLNSFQTMEKNEFASSDFVFFPNAEIEQHYSESVVVL